MPVSNLWDEVVQTRVEQGYIAATLEQSLAILRSDAAVSYYRLTRELDGLSIFIEVDQECFQLRCGVSSIVFGALSEVPDVRVRTTADTILALIDGARGVIDCVLGGELDLRARFTVLPNIARASVAFAEGAIRTRRMRALLTSFREEVTQRKVAAAHQSFRSIM